MKYRIATSTLAACLISFGAALGLQAQNRYDNHRNDDQVQESAIQQYAALHHLSGREMRDLEVRARLDQLSRDERRELVSLERGGTYRSDSYRYRLGNSWRTTTVVGAQLLQRAVSVGYQQGFESGQMAARRGRGFSPQRERMWRDGTYGYSNVIGQDDYRNYFREGFTRGYEDGYYSRNRYGSYVDGRATILGNVLGGILGFTIH